MPTITSSSKISLCLRHRILSKKVPDHWEQITNNKLVPANQLAIVICDIWDDHWCKSAAERVNSMAKKTNTVISTARNKGVHIIHSPSDTMNFYKNYPQRLRMLNTKYQPVPEELHIPTPPPLPIDDSDGGCDSEQNIASKKWTRQHPAIEIADQDMISDQGKEIYSFIKSAGISKLILVGVHTNMCILNRSFAIKQMAKWGIECVLVRDLTDSMYNPKRYPYISHQSGTKLVIEYIEKYWCPTIASHDITK